MLSSYLPLSPPPISTHSSVNSGDQESPYQGNVAEHNDLAEFPEIVLMKDGLRGPWVKAMGPSAM